MSGLDVESIAQIRAAIKEETSELKEQITRQKSELKEQLTREISLIVGPVKETLVKHIDSDESRDKDVYGRLNKIDKVQADLRSDVKTGRAIGGGLWALCVAGFATAVSYFKNGGS